MDLHSQLPSFNTNLNSYRELRESFFNPPAKYRTAPFYVWNDSITERQIDEMLADYKSKGIGGVFIHARPGLITEFLSDDWNRLVKYAVGKGKSLGMQIWIYDENTYPSGNAGGHVPAMMPESNKLGSAIEETSYNRFPEELDKPYFIILKKEGDRYVEITNTEAEKGKEGEYHFYEKKYYRKSAWYAGNTYVDLLNPEVTLNFLSIVMKGNEANVKEEFGKTIPGMFTDEPGIYIEYICWTPALFDSFMKRWDYDLKLCLPSLSYEVGDWRKVRHDYFTVISDLLVDGFAKPYSQYCKEHNLVFTGHFLEHDWPAPSMTPDFMAMQAFEDMPGIDNLFNQYDESTNAQFGNIRMPREVRSVANQMGKTRTLSETYGGSGWNLSFQDMKRIADWQFATGINFVNQHLSFTTIKGWRKRDYPQSFSAHEPWWNLYKNMADYLSRMSLAMSSGDQMNNIVVIEPTTSAWMYFSRNGSNQRFSETASAFTDFINGLEKYQLEYDLGSERNIERFGSSEKGKFIIGKRAYGIVVIPPVCDNLDKATFDLLARFLKDGGNVIDFSSTPGFIDGLPSDKAKKLADAYPGQWLKMNSLNDSKALSSLSSNGFSVIHPENIKGKLLHQRRQLTDGQLILLTNTSKDYWSKGSLQVTGKSVLLLDAVNGKISPYPSDQKGTNLMIDFEIPQCGSLLLYVSNETGISGKSAQKEASLKTLDAVSAVKVEGTRPNTLTLDYCDLKFIDGTTEKGLYVVSAGNKIFRHFGFRDGNPWSNPQYKTQFADSAKFPENSGFEATYHLTIDKGVDVSGFQASVEQSELWDLTVNGTLVKPIPGKIWLDRHFSQYNIGSLLKDGDNELKLTAAKMTVHSELEAIYIIGKFGLESMDKGFRIIEPKSMEIGSWKGQGLQMYSGSVSYTGSYDIHKSGKHFIVALDEWNGSVAEVAVNGKSAGIIYSEPYELDITDYTNDGTNSITVFVYGSLRNLLGPHHSKAVGMSGPGDFAAAPKQQPSGYSYNLDDYGLFSNFKVLEVSGEPQRYYRKKDYPVMERVSEPVISVDKQASGVSMKKLTISCTTADAEIFYTTDGSAPTLNSNRYITPLEFSNSACIKAVAFKNGMQQSNTAVKNIVLGINIINAVYKTPYTKYSAGGVSALFDGERGTENFGDGKWQGFEFNDLDVTFELVKSQAINSISVGFLEQIGSWIYFPSEVEISVSADGKDFRKAGVFTSADFTNNQGEPSKDISVELKNTEARFVRVYAKNIGKCPEDDPGSGGKAWIFCDEVIIK